MILFNSLCCRKYTILLTNVLAFLGVGLESLAVHPAMFIMGRFIIGVQTGKREGRRKGEKRLWSFLTYIQYAM